MIGKWAEMVKTGRQPDATPVERLRNMEIESVYQTYPVLRSVERADKTTRRRPVLELAPKNGIGAELGVFTGAFSEVIHEVTRPSKIYLVDVWHTVYGDRFPKWGKYTACGELTTEAALAAVHHRARQMDGKAEVVVESCLTWLAKLPESSLDWAYLDTSHKYETTMDELPAIARVLKPGGVILGDDCQIDPEHKHHGVFRAVRDFVQTNDFEIIWLDGAHQFAIRRTIG